MFICEWLHQSSLHLSLIFLLFSHTAIFRDFGFGPLEETFWVAQDASPNVPQVQQSFEQHCCLLYVQRLSAFRFLFWNSCFCLLQMAFTAEFGYIAMLAKGSAQVQINFFSGQCKSRILNISGLVSAYKIYRKRSIASQDSLFADMVP